VAIEIEKKYKLTDVQYDAVSASLNEIGAVFDREDFEENILFGGGILNEIPAVLRLRKVADKTILTFKQRIVNNLAVKQQTEHETEIANREAIEQIIESLGYKPRIIYEKYRKTYHFNGAEIVLDELPFGLFMEIEGSITEIELAEIMLEAEDFETEHATYPSLTVQFGTRNGEVFEARFPNTAERLNRKSGLVY
jgi:adenylate cyclase, class 2